MDITRQYLERSELDFLGPFANLWIGFNSWYRCLYPEETSDQAAALRMEEKFSPEITKQLSALNNIDDFISTQVDSLSECECRDYTYSRDVSGFKFRIQCANSHPVTEFLKLSKEHDTLCHYVDGLRFFESIGTPDFLFKALYVKYRQYEASDEGMALPADVKQITMFLSEIDVEHYGHMVFHNFAAPKPGKLYSLDDVFGDGRGSICSSIIDGKPKKVEGKSEKEVERNPAEKVAWDLKVKRNSAERVAWDLKDKAPTITKLYLYTLYKFRCEYLHGSLEPKSRPTQELAKAAFFSLRGLMESTFPQFLGIAEIHSLGS